MSEGQPRRKMRLGKKVEYATVSVSLIIVAITILITFGPIVEQELEDSRKTPYLLTTIIGAEVWDNGDGTYTWRSINSGTTFYSNLDNRSQSMVKGVYEWNITAIESEIEP